MRRHCIIPDCERVGVHGLQLFIRNAGSDTSGMRITTETMICAHHVARGLDFEVVAAPRGDATVHVWTNGEPAAIRAIPERWIGEG